MPFGTMPGMHHLGTFVPLSFSPCETNIYLGVSVCNSSAQTAAIHDTVRDPTLRENEMTEKSC